MKRHKRHKSHTKLVILLLLSIECLIILSFLVYLQVRPMVVEKITIEAGADMPDVKEFLLHKNRNASYITDTRGLNDPGSYEIRIKIGKRVYKSNLQLVDTTAPTAKAVDKLALKGEDIKPEEFLSDIKDETDVTLSYINAPDTSKVGDQEVEIVLEDAGKNRTEIKAKLTVLDIKNMVTIEAGSVMNITIKDFIDSKKYDISLITDLSKLDIDKVTVHKVLLSVNGREVNSNLKVVDTTAPNAVFSDGEVWQGDTPEAMSFVTSLQDSSKVMASYEVNPDFTKTGIQKATIVLEDEYGNQSEGQVSITVKEDAQPPQIVGTRNKTVYIGESVAYKKGVSVTDNRDKNLVVKVNSSTVNLKKEGVYNVIYTAEDTAGNQSMLTTTITVKKLIVTEEMVNTKADKILADIITEDMTKWRKCKQIYLWVKSHIGYTGDSDKTDWLAEAYRGMMKGKGDCFTFYSVSQALLTRAGIDNMRVTRVGGRTQHFWNLVNYGSGWYHFDACPNKDKKESFMMTDKEVQEFTKIRGNNYYTFDQSLYPATPEK